MTTNTTTTASGSSTERGIAITESIAPIVTGILAPMADSGAAFTGTIAYGLGAGFLAANYMNRLPPNLLHHLPAGDIIRAHSSPMFISTLTTGVALGMGTLMGPEGADALMAGILDVPANPIPGIISLGWWAAVGLVPFKLRNVLRRVKQVAHPAIRAAATTATEEKPINADDILKDWATHISNPVNGTHKGQELTLRTLSDQRWTGTITARTGSSVTVTAEVVSSVYKKPADWITITPGAHSGEKHIIVNRVAPPELDTETLQGAWRNWVAKTNGLMAGTHLEHVQPDPHTDGEVALVVAGDNLDRLRHPDRIDLAGALRVKNPLLISYEPRQNPREAVIRMMKHNPLQKGAAFPGVHVLKPNNNGYIQLGPGVSGFPARIQIWDPSLGAQHVIVAGVTGSGKGGTLQLIALAHHVNGSSIINADPKGSSNPAIEKMAAYSGLGPDGAMGALRIWYHGLQYRVQESARLGMKNFKPTPDRPWVPLILDEASKLLGENAEHRKEATYIINAGATLGRSLGMPVILANQLMQLAQLGGDAAIRDNVFYGGSLILLRSDSQQKHLIDLPENFAGCNPADIPPAWSGERDMIYDPNKPLNDPERTFGLAFAASPGGHAEMMRNWILEDATPYVDTNNIAYPVDWPFWEDRHELASQSVLPGDDKGSDDWDGGSSTIFTPVNVTKKEPSAEDKILQALREHADPMHLDALNGADLEPGDYEIQYMEKTALLHQTGLKETTLSNTLNRLVKEAKIHRPADSRGMYGLGPAPDADDE